MNPLLNDQMFCARGWRLVVALAVSSASVVAAAQPAPHTAWIQVSNTKDSGPGSLRAAIELANRQLAAKISFNTGRSGIIVLEKDLPAIQTNLDIDGPGSLTIDGGGIYQPIKVGMKGGKSSPNVMLSGLIVKNGISACIWNFGKLRISNCTISSTGNQAYGLANEGTLNASNCSFSSNRYSGLWNAGTANLSNCLFKENKGDGIYNTGTIKISNCDLSGNALQGLNNEGVANASNNRLNRNGNCGIFDTGTLSVSNCQSNENGFDGLAVNGGTVSASNCQFKSNHSNGLWNSGIVALSSCQLSGSTRGDGVYNSGTLSVKDCDLSANGAHGVYDDVNGKLALEGSKLNGNLNCGIYSAGTLSVTKSVACFNRYDGVYVLSGEVAATESKFSENHSDGMWNGGTASVTNCELSRNLGSGLYDKGTANITGSKLSGNQLYGIYSDLGKISNQTSNMVGNLRGSEKTTVYRLSNSFKIIEPGGDNLLLPRSKKASQPK